MWFFAPPSACTRLPCPTAPRCTARATGVEPTKLTAATSGWDSSRSTASRSPLTTFSTPGGNPASAASPASHRAAEGSFSLGFSTNAFPQATATGNIHSGTIAGKLNGVIPATTPSGLRSEATSTPVDTSVDSSPFSCCGMPHASSTISRPRATSPSASAGTLPCSAVISPASSSRRAVSSSR